MYLADLHIHSKYSFDSTAELEDIAARAISVGLSEIAVTDHCEICNNKYIAESYDNFDAGGAFDALTKIKESFDGKLKIKYGIELGQGHHNIKTAESITSLHNYDIIIGSLHNLSGMLDFYYLDYSKIEKSLAKKLFEAYLEEIHELVLWGGFDTLAHFGYPFRYMKEGSLEFSIDEYMPKIEEILSLIIKKKISLEVNTSGYRQGLDSTIPQADILSRYYALGGRMVTLGSDAHKPEQIGFEFEKAVNMLHTIGFEYLYTYTERKPQKIKI